jgi:alkaline phosphatase D
MMHTPTLATWDDHDYVENNTDGYSSGKETALAVFSDYWPNPAHGTDAVPGVFFSTSYGDVDFFFLDGRYYRGYNDSVLGNDQMAWLQQELLLSTATFKIIALGVQWTLTDTNDSWFEYSAARNAFFDFLRDNAIDGVAFLSGDVHFSEFRTLNHTGLYDLTDFTSSPIARESPSSCRASYGEQVFCYDGGNSYVTLEIRTDVTAPYIKASIHMEHGPVWDEYTIYYADLIP